MWLFKNLTRRSKIPEVYTFPIVLLLLRMQNKMFGLLSGPTAGDLGTLALTCCLIPSP